MARKQQKFTFILGLLMLSRFVMRRIHPSLLIRARELVDAKKLAKLGLSQDTFDDLPRHSFHGNGRPMEPMNLILVGSEEQVLYAFLTAGWHEADVVSLKNVLHAWFALITNGQYLNGPVTPLFAENSIQAMAFQKPTRINKFKQRHHLRIWATPFKDTEGADVWIVHASYDIGMKGTGFFQFPPAHRIAPDIDAERDMVAEDLKKAGAKLRGLEHFQNPYEGFNAFDDEFKTDGKIAVVDVSYVA